MTIEKRIEAALKRHVWYFVGNLGVPRMPDRKGYKCYCGWETHGDDDKPPADPWAHVASMLVAELGLTLQEDADFTGGGLVRYATPWEPDQ